MKRYCLFIARKLVDHGLKPFSENEKQAIRLAFQFMYRHPITLSVMLITGLLAAVFEGGSIGILGLSVGTLAGESSGIPIKLPDYFDVHVDKYIGTISRGGIFLFLVGIAVIAQIVKGLLIYVSTIAQIELGFGLQGDAQDKATHQVMSLSYADIGKFPSGELVSLVDQAGVISNVVSEVGKAFRALLMVISYILVMLLISLTLTISSIVIFTLLFISFNGLVRNLKKASRDAFLSLIDTTRWAVEFINAPRLLRIFTSGETAEKVVREARYRRISSEIKVARIMAIILPAFEIVTVFGAGLFLIVGYLLAGESAIEVVPKLFVFVLVFFRLKPQVKLLNDLRLGFAKLLPQLEVVGRFLNKSDKSFDRIGGAAFNGLMNEIELRDVSFSYEGTNKQAISNVTFLIRRGETVAIVGASGAGKSTVVDLILQLYLPSSGKIMVDGVDLASLDIKDWRRSVGVVDQDVFLLNASIEDNISFGRLDKKFDNIKTAAKVAHADEFIINLSDGYHTIVGDRGHKLSGGEQQRLALARAVLREPDILILDEATSALDTLSERLIQRAIEDMHKKATIVVIAHRLATVVNADKIIVLDNGRVVEVGTNDSFSTFF